MSELATIIMLRAGILIIGAAICWYGGKKGEEIVRKLSSNLITRFIKILVISVILLGTTMLFIAIGNLLTEFVGGAWSYMFLVSAGIVGVGSVAMFLLAIEEITKYVVIK